MTMLILDGLLILVIAWGVIYAWKTSKSMQNIKNEMKPVTRQLGSYLNIIGQHLNHFKETTESNKRTLTEQLPQAKALKDDFEVLLDHGSRLAERLDVLLEQAYAIEKELRTTNTNLTLGSSSSLHTQTPITRETIRHRPYSEAMQQHPTPTPTASEPFATQSAAPGPAYSYPQQQHPQLPNIGIPYPQPPHHPMPHTATQTEQLEAARSHVMQARGEMINRLKGVRV